MNCTIQWNTYTHTQWNELLKKCPHTTILQAYYYAQAMREVKQQGVRHGLILIDEQEAGIVQLQEISVLGQLIHVISIDRGPCWFDGYGSAEHITAFAEIIDKEFPKRFGQKRRIMLEYHDKNRHAIMGKLNIRQNISIYKTFSVDISQEMENIRQKLQKRWKRSLLKAEKGCFSVEIDENLKSLSHFLTIYVQDRFEKGYHGASPRFLASLAKFAATQKKCLIFNAKDNGETIGAILVFIHGCEATYQTGWTTPKGRDQNAHHLLFWKAIEVLKQKGVTCFDLGGHNDQTKGLYDFKKGLGGQEIALIGSYA